MFSNRTAGKREAGANPARSRHCKQGADGHDVTGKPGRRPDAWICKPGNLPDVGTGKRAEVQTRRRQVFRITSNWSYRILVCPFTPSVKFFQKRRKRK